MDENDFDADEWAKMAAEAGAYDDDGGGEHGEHGGEWTMGGADEAEAYEGEYGEDGEWGADGAGAYDGAAWSSSIATSGRGDDDDDGGGGPSAMDALESVDEAARQDRDDVARVEQLRLESARLLSRKNAAMEMLVELFEKGLCKLDALTSQGTKEEDEAFYEKQLMEFKEKKEAFLERSQALKEMIRTKTEIAESKRKECINFIDKQNDLELKMAVSVVIDKKTNKPMLYDNVISMLNACAVQNEVLNKCQLRYITWNNRCKKLKNDFNHLKTTFNLDEYQDLLIKNQGLEDQIEHKKDSIIKDEARVKMITEDTSKISKKIEDLKLKKEDKINELIQLKEKWTRNHEIKLHNIAVLNRRNYACQLKSQQAANRSLLRNYHECLEQAKKNKKVLAELRQKVSANLKDIECLRAMERGEPCDNNKTVLYFGML